MGRVTTRVPVRKIRYAASSSPSPRPDTVVVEEPLEIRINGEVCTVTMRTPGADIDLIHGYLVAEGVIRSASDIVGARYCAGSVSDGPDGTVQNTYNVVEVDLARPDAARLLAASRIAPTTSACGVCGSASIEVLMTKLPDSLEDLPVTLAAADVPEYVAKLAAGQGVFRSTGGAHAAAVFGIGGSVRAHAEDIGRHNAVDKAIGAVVRAGGEPPLGGVLAVSSRASYEIVQKAAMAGIPVVIAVSAPSSLAVAAAEALGMSLFAFARDDGVNVYAGAARLRDKGAGYP